MSMVLSLNSNSFRLNYCIFIDMSNRNFDNRVVISRLQNQVYARNLYTNNMSGKKIINNQQNTDSTASRYGLYHSGAQTEYFRGLIGGGETVSVGGIVNIPPYTTVPSLSAVTFSTPAPSPAPEAAYTPNTQLLLNPEFTNITNSAADNWHSTQGWQAWNLTSGSRPTAMIDMPTRDVYPVSNSSGFVIFSYTTVTISQTISIDNLIGINTITGVLNIANVSNGATDTFTFLIEYKSSTGSILYTTTTNSTNAPASWTDYTLTLTRDESPNFDSIKSIKVSIVGKDTGFWAGQYGPAMDYCRLTVS